VTGFCKHCDEFRVTLNIDDFLITWSYQDLRNKKKSLVMLVVTNQFECKTVIWGVYLLLRLSRESCVPQPDCLLTLLGVAKRKWILRCNIYLVTVFSFWKMLLRSVNVQLMCCYDDGQNRKSYCVVKCAEPSVFYFLYISDAQLVARQPHALVLSQCGQQSNFWNTKCKDVKWDE
jgi:hypothetical protein